jgi:hypothetical protein
LREACRAGAGLVVPLVLILEELALILEAEGVPASVVVVEKAEEVVVGGGVAGGDPGVVEVTLSTLTLRLASTPALAVGLTLTSTFGT